MQTKFDTILNTFSEIENHSELVICPKKFAICWSAKPGLINKWILPKICEMKRNEAEKWWLKQNDLLFLLILTSNNEWTIQFNIGINHVRSTAELINIIRLSKKYRDGTDLEGQNTLTEFCLTFTSTPIYKLSDVIENDVV